MATTMMHVRIEEKVKAKAAKALKAMGMSVSDVVRVLLVRVATEQKLPFDVCVPHVPNAKTAKALRDAAKGKGFLPSQTLEQFMASVRADVNAGD
jgi:DNA-damage-inducible protein J